MLWCLMCLLRWMRRSWTCLLRKRFRCLPARIRQRVRCLFLTAPGAMLGGHGSRGILRGLPSPLYGLLCAHGPLLLRMLSLALRNIVPVLILLGVLRWTMSLIVGPVPAPVPILCGESVSWMLPHLLVRGCLIMLLLTHGVRIRMHPRYRTLRRWSWGLGKVMM